MARRFRLHGTPISPYARKVMILAGLHGVELDIIPAEAQGSNGYTGGDNPLGKVPALEWRPDTHPGEWLFDSPVICEWLDARADAPLLPADPGTQTRQKRLHALGDGVSDATYNLRYELARPEALHWPDMVARHESALRNALAALDTERDALGGAWTYGNLAVVCALDYLQFRAAHLDWRALAPRLATWHEGARAWPHYQSTYAYP